MLNKFLVCIALLLAMACVLIGCSTGAQEEVTIDESTLSPTPAPDAQEGENTLEPSAVSPNAAPFSYEDVQAYTANLTTVKDYVEAFAPQKYSWWYEGEATGVTYLIFSGEYADATVMLTSPDGTILGMQEAEDQLTQIGDALPEQILSLTCYMSEICIWGKEFSAIVPVRGIHIGDARDKVLNAYLNKGVDGALALYTNKDVYPDIETFDYDEWYLVGGQHILAEGDTFERIDYGWADVTAEWKEYYLISFRIQGDKVDQITLGMSTAAE